MEAKDYISQNVLNLTRKFNFCALDRFVVSENLRKIFIYK